MKYVSLMISAVLLSIAVCAQPVWSPGVRAKREAQWMQDSLHLTTQQLQKVYPILLNYQQKIDNTSGSVERQHKLMKEKDGSLKSIFSKKQYAKYYRREEELRARPVPAHTGARQTY